MDRYALILVAVLVAGCAASPPIADDAYAILESLERRLLAAEITGFNFEVEAHGRVNARMHGSFRRAMHGSLALDARGHFADNSVDVMLRANPESTTFGQGGQIRVLPTPPALDEAVLIGFTRMGILHNLAMLSAGRPPDRADGGVREWLGMTDLTLVDDPDPEVHVLTFVLNIDSNPVANATLWIDRATMRPLRRRQSVRFPDGTMEVVERYAYP